MDDILQNQYVVPALMYTVIGPGLHCAAIYLGVGPEYKAKYLLSCPEQGCGAALVSSQAMPSFPSLAL